MKRWLAWGGAALLLLGGIGYWVVSQRLNAPLLEGGADAQAQLQADIEAQNEQAYFKPARAPLEIKTANANRNVYFGDLHVHTSLSFDAYLFGTRLDPDAAYRFAKGEPGKIITGEAISLSRPLDFVALTDHAEGFGFGEACARPERSADADQFCNDFGQPSVAFFLRLRNSGEARPPVRDLTLYEDSPEMARALSSQTWRKVKDAADRHYEPGRFTTFAAYEYSPVLADTGKHHRNVIFRSSETPESAVSAYDAPSEIDLWKALEASCEGDCEFLTIPHNPNKSWGLAFASETIDGVPYTAADWQLRARSEPLVEMFQIKGNSECSIALGVGDEECGFEQFLPPCEPGQETLCVFPTSMVRDGLKTGLSLEAELGMNPLQFGLIGATDTHNANPGDAEEWDFRGASGYLTSPAKRRLSGGRGGSRAALERNPGGLAAVWAEENTREALFDAMKRREAYATSGTRIRLRVFAGFDYAPDAAVDLDALYAGGVPMGGVLESSGADAPLLFVWALQDQMHAPLAKVQVVKGWLDEDGAMHERVFDIACADGEPSAPDGRCSTPVSELDLSTCRWSSAAGTPEIQTWWRDPDYRADHSTFYYVRVVQVPTCRWTTYDALRVGQSPPEGLPAAVREMAWASPIWVQPLR